MCTIKKNPTKFNCFKSFNNNIKKQNLIRENTILIEEKNQQQEKNILINNNKGNGIISSIVATTSISTIATSTEGKQYQNNSNLKFLNCLNFCKIICLLPIKMANSITNVIRNVVSKQRKRYVANGYDLDLSYICDNIIAMGYPAANIEKWYRNHIDDVVKFLEENHKDHYKIYNLCSERNYDISTFHGRVAVYPFADHNPPTIELMQKFCDDINGWLKGDERNVAAVHCKAGKGRTGTMICCYLLQSGFARTADDALRHYDEKRTKDKKGVTIPSQRRYVEYYAKLLNSGKPYERRTLQICEIRFSSPPLSYSQGTMLSLSTLDDPSCPDKVKTLQNFAIDFRKTSAIEITDRCIPVTGDVRIELYHKVTKKTFLHLWFNVYFIVEEGERQGSGDDMKIIYEFKKNEIDDAHKDKENKTFSEDFSVQLVFQTIPSRNNFANTCGEKTNSLVIHSINNHNVYNSSATSGNGAGSGNNYIVDNTNEHHHNQQPQIDVQSMIEPLKQQNHNSKTSNSNNTALNNSSNSVSKQQQQQHQQFQEQYSFPTANINQFKQQQQQQQLQQHNRNNSGPMNISTSVSTTAKNKNLSSSLSSALVISPQKQHQQQLQNQELLSNDHQIQFQNQNKLNISHKNSSKMLLKQNLQQQMNSTTDQPSSNKQISNYPLNQQQQQLQHLQQQPPSLQQQQHQHKTHHESRTNSASSNASKCSSSNSSSSISISSAASSSACMGEDWESGEFKCNIINHSTSNSSTTSTTDVFISNNSNNKVILTSNLFKKFNNTIFKNKLETSYNNNNSSATSDNNVNDNQKCILQTKSLNINKKTERNELNIITQNEFNRDDNNYQNHDDEEDDGIILCKTLKYNDFMEKSIEVFDNEQLNKTNDNRFCDEPSIINDYNFPSSSKNSSLLVTNYDNLLIKKNSFPFNSSNNSLKLNSCKINNLNNSVNNSSSMTTTTNSNSDELIKNVSTVSSSGSSSSSSNSYNNYSSSSSSTLSNSKELTGNIDTIIEKFDKKENQKSNYVNENIINTKDFHVLKNISENQNSIPLSENSSLIAFGENQNETQYFKKNNGLLLQSKHRETYSISSKNEQSTDINSKISSKLRTQSLSFPSQQSLTSITHGEKHTCGKSIAVVTDVESTLNLANNPQKRNKLKAWLQSFNIKRTDPEFSRNFKFSNFRNRFKHQQTRKNSKRAILRHSNSTGSYKKGKFSNKNSTENLNKIESDFNSSIDVVHAEKNAEHDLQAKEFEIKPQKFPFLDKTAKANNQNIPSHYQFQQNKFPNDFPTYKKLPNLQTNFSGNLECEPESENLENKELSTEDISHKESNEFLDYQNCENSDTLDIKSPNSTINRQRFRNVTRIRKYSRDDQNNSCSQLGKSVDSLNDYYSSLCDRQLSFGTSPLSKSPASLVGSYGNATGVLNTNNCVGASPASTSHLKLIHENPVEDENLLTPTIVAKPVNLGQIGFFTFDKIEQCDEERKCDNAKCSTEEKKKIDIIPYNYPSVMTLKNYFENTNSTTTSQRSPIATDELDAKMFFDSGSSSNNYVQGFGYNRQTSKYSQSFMNQQQHPQSTISNTSIYSSSQSPLQSFASSTTQQYTNPIPSSPGYQSSGNYFNFGCMKKCLNEINSGNIGSVIDGSQRLYSSKGDNSNTNINNPNTSTAATTSTTNVFKRGSVP